MILVNLKILKFYSNPIYLQYCFIHPFARTSSNCLNFDDWGHDLGGCCPPTGNLQLDHCLIRLTSGDNEDGNAMTLPGVLDGNNVTGKKSSRRTGVERLAFDPLRFSGDNQDWSDQKYRNEDCVVSCAIFVRSTNLHQCLMGRIWSKYHQCLCKGQKRADIACKDRRQDGYLA